MTILSDPHVEARRFQGIERVYGQQARAHFNAAHVCIIGLGGVGSWAVEALARSAIGELTLIDLDIIALSNINRQLHALESTLGMPKVDVMAERIGLINPGCNVNRIEDFISEKNISSLITQNFNYVIDCIDNFRLKAALAAHCKRQKIKLILTGGAGGQTDPGRVKISDLSRTEHDPLLAKVRKRLRQQYHFPRNPKRRFDLPCVYSDEQLRYPGQHGEITFDKSRVESTTGLNCAQGFGSAMPVTASFGLFAASHVLKKLAETA